MSAEPMHFHSHATAYGLPRDITPEEVGEWFKRLVAAVGMDVLGGPFATYCDIPGNEGVTGIIWLTTSHASIHIWQGPGVAEPYAKADLYSCRPFSTATWVKLVQELAPNRVTGDLFDRSGDHSELLERFEWPTPGTEGR